jgi:flagellin
MSDNVILSAAVRQNLLALQDTASLMAITQQRLATGKKVNSALDDPSAFFTSQALSSRASDLQTVLNQIGQAVQTINAANNGITSITTLVQSAKSLAQQATATTAPTSTYSSVDSSSNILGASNLNGVETIATTTGTADLEPLPISLAGQTITETLGQNQSANTIVPVANNLSFTSGVTEAAGAFTSTTNVSGGTGTTNGDTISFTVTTNGVSTTYTTAALTANESQANLVAALNAATNSGGHSLTSVGTATFAASGNFISLTDNNVATNVTITANADTAAAGLTTNASTNNAVNSTNLASVIGGSGNTLAVDVNGTTTTLTIDATHIQTLAQLNTALAAITGAGAGESGGTITFDQTAGATNTLGLTVSSAGVASALGLNTAATAVNLANGTNRGGLGSALTRTYNSNPTLAEIDPTNLSADSTLNFSVNLNDGNGPQAVSVTVHPGDNIAAVINDLQTNTTINNNFTIANVAGKLTLTAKTSNVDLTTDANAASADLGLTADAVTNKTTNSNSLLDQLNVASGPASAQGDTLVLSGTSASGAAFSQTITFGTDVAAGQVRTLAELNAALGTAATDSSGAFSANATPTTNNLAITGHIAITQASGDQSTITVGGTVDTLTGTAAILQNGAGTLFSTHDSAPSLNDLDPANLSNGGALNFTVNGQAFTIGFGPSDNIGSIVTKLNNSAIGSEVTFSAVTDNAGHQHIEATGKDASVALTIDANDTSTALGLTVNATTNNTPPQQDLLSLLNTKLGGSAGQGATLTVQVNGGTVQTITFGTGTNQVQTVAQLNTQLGALSGVTASVSNAGALDINEASSSSATSVTLGGTAATSLGLTAGTQNGTVLSTTANAARTSLQTQYNNVLTQIDSMAKDSSFNGVNLLGGDNLTIAYNEDGSSSQTVQGTVVSSSNLGLSQLNGSQFQDNTQLTAIVAATDSAITQLATDGSNLGSALTTVQARQTFTTAMVTTLQTGSDNLVLADTNEEGANMLALQTRQQLSTTALSLANQANQAVLRLFG